MHGQWAVQNNFLLDGVDNNSQVMGIQDRKAQVLVPNIDAIQEFQVQTSNYTAEFGRGAGAVVNVSIKSGTNVIHGTVHEFLRNDIFDARDAFDYFDCSGDGKADPNALQQHQFGFTLGGPIRKSRTFYFASLEISRVNTEENRLLTVPALAERDGTFDPESSSSAIRRRALPFQETPSRATQWDPVAARLLDLWPAPNFEGTTRANHSSNPAHERLRGQNHMRLDHTFSSRDRMFVRGSWMDFNGERLGSFPAPGIGGGNNDFARDDNTAYNLAVSETHVFGSSVVHEIRLGVNSLRTNKQPLGRGYPNDDYGLHVESPSGIEGLSASISGGALCTRRSVSSRFNPNDKTAGTLQVLDNLSICQGRAHAQTGADLRWVRSDSIGAQFARGIFTFNGRFTGSSFGDFLLGMTSGRQFSTIQFGNLRERDYMFYAQDDWRIARQLTLNTWDCDMSWRARGSTPSIGTERTRCLGVSRSASDSGGGGRPVVVGSGARSNRHQQLGAADRSGLPTRTGVDRAGRVGTVLRHAERCRPGRAPPQQLAPVTGGHRALYRGNVRRPARGRDRCQSARKRNADARKSFVERRSPDFTTPTISQWNLSLQRQLGPSWVVTTAYVGSSSRHLQRLYNMNAAGPGDSRTERERRMIPSLGAITMTDSSGSASYHGLQATMDKRLSRGWQGSLWYTWSHSIDDVLELAGGEGNVVIQDWRNPRGDRGNSGFDRRHRLVAYAALDLPFGAGRRWLQSGGPLGLLLGDWQVSAIVSAQSGAHFDVTVLDPTNRLGITVGSSVWRPDLVGDPGVSDPTADAWVNPAAFAIPQNPDGSYRYGTLGRNTLLGPGLQSGRRADEGHSPGRYSPAADSLGGLQCHEPSVFRSAEYRVGKRRFRHDQVDREHAATDAVRRQVPVFDGPICWPP